MGQFREYNPKMISEWTGVRFDRVPEDARMEISKWGRPFQTWTGYIERQNATLEWCKGPMIHGRFALDNVRSWGHVTFYFKSKKDAMTFKLTYGGS